MGDVTSECLLTFQNHPLIPVLCEWLKNKCGPDPDLGLEHWDQRQRLGEHNPNVGTRNCPMWNLKYGKR